MNPDDLRALFERHASRHVPSAAGFMRRVFAMAPDVYDARIRQYGFVGKRAVLDAGCGFGQWSLALAAHNDAVEACDVSEARVAFVNDAIATAKVANVRAHVADIGRLPWEAGRFDAVFCYGALHLTPWRTTLAELARVLAPGGLLYVNANGFGWYRHLWFAEPHKSPDYDPRMRAAETLLNTCRYDRGEPPEPGMDILIEPDALVSAIGALGLDVVERADEGCAGATDLVAARARAFFRGRYGDDLGIYEILARKRGP